MKIALVVGHSRLRNGNYTSANGVLNEYLYNVELAPIVREYLEKLGHSVALIICPEGHFIKSTEEKKYKLDIVNKGNFDLVVELHLNAGGGHGSEVLYISEKGKLYAERVQAKLATIFRNRGVKKRNNLYMLNGTKPIAILVESFFCDSKSDCEIGADKELVARLIAEGITGQAIKVETKDELYQVQCGAFKSHANAESYRDVIIDKGYQAFVKYISPYYKVQVGAFSVRANAEKLSKELTAKGISNFIA